MRRFFCSDGGGGGNFPHRPPAGGPRLLPQRVRQPPVWAGHRQPCDDGADARRLPPVKPEPPLPLQVLGRLSNTMWQCWEQTNKNKRQQKKTGTTELKLSEKFWHLKRSQYWFLYLSLFLQKSREMFKWKKATQLNNRAKWRTSSALTGDCRICPSNNEPAGVWRRQAGRVRPPQRPHRLCCLRLLPRTERQWRLLRWGWNPRAIKLLQVCPVPCGDLDEMACVTYIPSWVLLGKSQRFAN